MKNCILNCLRLLDLELINYIANWTFVAKKIDKRTDKLLKFEYLKYNYLILLRVSAIVILRTRSINHSCVFLIFCLFYICSTSTDKREFNRRRIFLVRTIIICKCEIIKSIHKRFIFSENFHSKYCCFCKNLRENLYYGILLSFRVFSNSNYR